MMTHKEMCAFAFIGKWKYKLSVWNLERKFNRYLNRLELSERDIMKMTYCSCSLADAIDTVCWKIIFPFTQDRWEERTIYKTAKKWVTKSYENGWR